VCYRCFVGVFYTAFITFIVGTIVGARTILGYFATTGVLELAGIMTAACLNSCWRNKTLYAYQVNNELPSKMIDDDDGLEMGMLAVKEDPTVAWSSKDSGK
jgi:hypothetical protein